MLNFPSIRHIHLIGICGTAMASLAGMLKASGYTITGSDYHIYPPMSEFLQTLKIPLFQGYSEEHLCPHPDLVVVGNAISRGNPEVEYMLNARLRYASMAEVLKECFLRGKTVVVVAGTHGKTTTASLLAWLLEYAGTSPGFLVGGIAENFGSSFRLGNGKFFVVEGDEYDTAFFDKGPKFLHYLPDWVIFNNCEYDHADIYASFESVKTSFRRLINIIPSNGCLVAGWDDPVVRELSQAAFCPVLSFGLEEELFWSASAIDYQERLTRVEVSRQGQVWGAVETSLAGAYNVKNLLAGLACAQGLGISKQHLVEGLRSFKNVKRRLEIRGEARGVTIFDDFAHHPTAIRETLRGVKARYPGHRIWAIFEPRSATSRRNIFQKEFVEAFRLADQVVLSTPFAAEKLDPAVRLDVHKLVRDLVDGGTPAEAWDTPDEIVRAVTLRLTAGDKVVIMSNGGFGGIHVKLLEALGSAPEHSST